MEEKYQTIDDNEGERNIGKFFCWNFIFQGKKHVATS
jgi:hypothetical protein